MILRQGLMFFTACFSTIGGFSLINAGAQGNSFATAAPSTPAQQPGDQRSQTNVHIQMAQAGDTAADMAANHEVPKAKARAAARVAHARPAPQPKLHNGPVGANPSANAPGTLDSGGPGIVARQTGQPSPAPSARADQAAITASDNVVAIPDVIVGATRRREKDQDVPISTSVLSSTQLNQIFSNGSSVTGLAAQTPSLNVESSNGRTFPRFYIRGYGNTDFNTFASQPVEFVYDDIDQENPVLKGFPIFDVQDVEIFRGPQGTLFGRNAPAGVISVQSVQPILGRDSLQVTASEGTYNTANFLGVANGAVNDRVAVRLSVQEQRRDNWVSDPITSSHLNGYSDFAGRAQLLFKPSDNFTAVFNVHGRDLESSAQLFRANIIQPGTDSLVAGFQADTLFTDGRNTQQLGTGGANARLTWNLGSISLVSITGFEKIVSYYTQGDIDGGYGASFLGANGPTVRTTNGRVIGIPFPVDTGGGVTDHNQFTEEFRVQSNYTGPINWLVGGYYFYETVTSPNIDFDLTGSTITDFNVARQINSAPAVFGSVDYNALPNLELRGGARFTSDDKHFKILSAVGQSFAGDTSAAAVGRNLSGDFSATYHVLPDVSVYGRFATGFRAPSFGSPSSTVGIQVAKAETVISGEVGVKSALFNRRAKLNFDLYHFDVSNQQLTAVGGEVNATHLLNAKNTLGEGAEASLDVKVARDLTVRINASYNYTQIQDPTLAVAVCAACTVTNPLNAAGNALINGNSLPQAPRFIVDPSVRYDRSVGDDGDVFFYGDLAFRSKLNFFLYTSKEFTGQPLADLTLRAGYRWNSGRYEASAFCSNCANQIKAIGGIDFNNLTGYINEPLIAGVQLSAKF